MKINIAEVEVGDVFSEQNHLICVEKLKDSIKMKHLESGEVVELNNKYVEDLLQTADQYDSEVTVGLENKYFTQKQIDDLKKKLDSEWTYEIYGTISKDEMLNTYNQTMKK